MKAVRTSFPVGVALLAAVLLCIGWLGYGYSFQVFIFPLSIGLFVIAMAAIAAIAAYRARDGEPKKGATLGEEEDGTLLYERNAWVQFGALIALMALCWLLGFIAGIVVFVFLYLWLAGCKPWIALLYGAGAGFAIWLLFYFLFFTPLPFWPIFMR